MQIKSSKKIPLLDLLQENYPESSKNTLRSWVEKGRVLLEGKPIKKANLIVEEGQEVSVGGKPKFLRSDLKILYEDQDLVVVDKPAGLLSVATEKELELTAHGILKRRFHNRTVFPIHRLDKDTSGLLVFAYTTEARDHLKKQLEERTMMREYRALVHGHPGKGTWHCFLRENAQMVVHTCVPSQGKEAITHFETISKKRKTALLKLQLKTGRKHQIRVQAAHAGYPIVGDRKYGIEDGGKSLELRAVALSFIHPKTNKLLQLGEGFLTKKPSVSTHQESVGKN